MEHFPDIITLSNFHLSALIGIRDYEMLHPQRLTLNIRFSVDAALAAAEDDISQAIDYSSVYKEIHCFLGEHRFHLLETLAHQLALHLKATFSMGWVELAITKFPKDMPDVAGVTLTVQR